MATTFEDLVAIAREKKASDLYIVPGESPVLRVEGTLEVQSQLPAVTADDTERMLADIATPEEQKIFRDARELDMSVVTKDGTHLRVNLNWERRAVSVVARLIASEIPSLEDQFMPEVSKSILRATSGLVLITGPTGSGKSSSLAAMVDYINKERAEHIITFEDPIEFIFKDKKSVIIQRQLGTDVLSFAEGLKHAMRQDPNVIVVGEVRDPETMGAVLTLAETGHFVLATLHTPNAVLAVNRIIDLFPPHQQEQVRISLASVLTAVIAKLLLPRVVGGRIPAYEVLVNTPAVAGLIRENRVNQIQSSIETSGNQGMITMEQALRALREAGEITQETFDGAVR